MLVTEVFRFEQRDEALGVIATKTACPEVVSKDKKTYESGARDYSHYYDAASRRKIENYYRDDIERFDYQFEGE